MMLKNADHPKEPLRSKAARMWKNNDVRKKIVEERQSRNMPDPDADPQVTELIINDGRKSGRITRFENKFKSELRAMMDGHAARNLALYLEYLNARKVILLREKLRRLKAGEYERLEK